MSKTSTSIATVPTTRTISRSSSILLSPSKRRRFDGGRSRDRGHETHIPNETGSEQASSTPTEILRWTFTRAAIASCFVRDVFEMRDSGIKDMEFFWLGRIPCRTVLLVGLLVGVHVWEKRTIYTLDDGTAVVDCALAHSQVSPRIPVKPKPPFHGGSKETKRAGPSFTDYLLSARKSVPSVPALPRCLPLQPPSLSKPVSRVGQSVRVIGRVVSRYDTRMLLVDEIAPCASCNEESSHWLSVSELHSTTYYPSQTLPPFVPPPLTATSSSTCQSALSSVPASPSKRVTVQEPATPSSVSSRVASTVTSPSTTVGTSSPASSALGEHQIPRLRHPSRLHTRDLSANTFRIYVKHYMDNAPPPRRDHPSAMRERSVSPSPMPRSSQKRGSHATDLSYHHRDILDVDETPRPSRLRNVSTDRARSLSLGADNDTDADSDEEPSAGDDDEMYGYTLSHLRRVPELSTLAHRVLRADTRRRAKEERKKAMPHGTSSKSSRPSHSSTDAPLGPAVKRLFKQAIVTLFQEGDVVLWNGPVHPLSAPALDAMLPSKSSSALWNCKADTSTSSAVSTASSRSRPSYEEWDEDELSDPEPGEEAYAPLTPAYFSRVLEGAIQSIRASCARANAGDATPTHGRPASLIERLRAQEKHAGPPPGPTMAELLAWLRNSDERWERVGEWKVEEALEWGKREGRLWCVGKGRWEVCE